MPEYVQFEKHKNQTATLLIHRPEVRNALSWEAMEQFSKWVNTAGADEQLRALIITGGPEAFCAGGDLHELHDYPTHEDGVRLTALMGDALKQLMQLPCPTIAAIEGPAMGGGAEIALACDMRVAGESVKFGLMHVRLGIATAWGGGPRLLKLAGYARAIEWQTRGVVLNGEELNRYGLANSLVPDGDTLQEAQNIAAEIAAQDPAAVRAIKHMLITTAREGTQQGAEYERQIFPSLWTGSAHLEAAGIFVRGRREKR